MSLRLEKTILKSLIHNENYARKVLPFLKDEYFDQHHEKIIFNKIKDFIVQYNKLPTEEALGIIVDKTEKLSESVVESCHKTLDEIKNDKSIDPAEQWLLDESEKFCQEKAIYNAVSESITILDDKAKSNVGKGAIPKILADALAVSFDTNVGHDFLEDSTQRYEFYHRVENKVPFDIEFLNKITKGGVPAKTLNVILGGVNVGKSLILCHLASSYLSLGKNVLYITMEMAEEMIAKRIDANLLNVLMDDLELMTKTQYEGRVAKLKNKTTGKLIIKEYPTAAASVVHFRQLVNELFLKKNFKPDIVIVDYLNICASSRLKIGGSVNLYQYVKSIAEELRGFAVENNFIVWSASQLNRTGFASSDVELTDTSESFGLPATADFIVAVQTSEELEELNQYMMKQLKNRYGDVTKNKRFVVGVDRAKMRLYDTEQDAQDEILDSGQPQVKKSKQPFDNSKFGERLQDENQKGGSKRFSGLKV